MDNRPIGLTHTSRLARGYLNTFHRGEPMTDETEHGPAECGMDDPARLPGFEPPARSPTMLVIPPGFFHATLRDILEGEVLMHQALRRMRHVTDAERQLYDLRLEVLSTVLAQLR